MSEYLGLMASILVLALGFIFIQSRYRVLSSTQKTKKLANIISIISGLMILAIIFLWAIGKFDFGSYFSSNIYVIFASLLVASLNPQNKRTSLLQKMTILSGSLIFTFMLLIMLFTTDLSITAQVACILGILYAVIAPILFLSSNKFNKFYLLFQSLYIVVFQLVIILAIAG